MEVKISTDAFLKQLKYTELKRTFDEEAVWLIDYWCNKNITGLIKMPLSRHWIMHIEVMQRIKNKL